MTLKEKLQIRFEKDSEENYEKKCDSVSNEEYLISKKRLLENKEEQRVYKCSKCEKFGRWKEQKK